MENISSIRDSLVLRHPVPADGSGLNLLLGKSPPLDSNSIYCNLLQCTHFAGTSVAAEFNNTLVGFVSAYFPPERPDSLFIWQVVVADTFRGSGLAKKMLGWLTSQPVCKDAANLLTSISSQDKAARALFESFAKGRGATLRASPMFDSVKDCAEEGEELDLLRISPLFPYGQKSMQDHINDLKGHLYSRRSR